MKHLKIFEEIINPEIFNKQFYFEDNEDEEDDVYVPTELIGESIYRASFIFTNVDPDTGILKDYSYSDFCRMTVNGLYFRFWNQKFYNINLNIEEFKIDIKNDTIYFKSVPGFKKRTLSIKLNKFLTDNKLYNFYVRQFDVLSFDLDSLKEGLYEFINTQTFKKNIRLSKQYSYFINIKNDIDNLEKIDKNLEFIINNIDNLKPYLNENEIKKEYQKVKNDISIKRNHLLELEKLEYNYIDVEKLIEKL